MPRCLQSPCCLSAADTALYLSRLPAALYHVPGNLQDLLPVNLPNQSRGKRVELDVLDDCSEDISQGAGTQAVLPGGKICNEVGGLFVDCQGDAGMPEIVN